MAAPSSTVWGAIVNDKGKVGIYTAITSSDTQTAITVQVWLATKYSANDTSNELFYNAGPNVTAATTSMGAVTINHTSNSKWSTSNHTKIYEKTYAINRSTAKQEHKIYVKLSGITWVDGTMYAQSSFTVPALANYIVMYNANGGTGAPAAQTKWHGQSLTLSSQVPYMMGATFIKWESSYNGQYYDPGDFYGHNAPTTMKALYELNTFTVSYNANDGTGAPAAQTKTFGQTLTLSSTKPTRTNYNFLGWAASASATTATYAAGGSYTTNADATLYAVWELAYTPPTVSNLSVYRCDANGNADDYGTAAKIAFNWSVDTKQTDNEGNYVFVFYKTTDTANFPQAPQNSSMISGTSGTYNQTLFVGNLSADVSYDVQIRVTDKNGATDIVRTIGSVNYVIDFLAGGKGVAFNKPATKENAFDIGWPVYSFMLGEKGHDHLGKVITNGLAEYQSGTAIDPNETTENLILTNHANAPMGSGTFYYVVTVFAVGKSTSSYRAQYGIPYNQNGSMYHRYYNGTWSAWRRHVNADEGVLTSANFSYSNGTLTITTT